MFVIGTLQEGIWFKSKLTRRRNGMVMSREGAGHADR
jgi:hypothetical protein